MSVKRLIVGLALVALFGAWATVLALDAGRPLNQYSRDVWRDELPQATIHSILQTRDGYLWIATFEGVVRFDGVRFTVFDKRTIPDLRSNNVRALYEDRAGNLWIGTLSGGLLRYSGGTFTIFTTQQGLPADFVYSIFEDSRGRLWIGTNRGVSCLENGKFTNHPLVPNQPRVIVYGIGESPDGAVWLATYGRGLFRFKDDQFTAFTVADGLPKDNFYSLKVSRTGDIWFGSDGGGLVRLSNGRFTTYTVKDGLTSDIVHVIYEDRAGTLWIGTEHGGVNCLRNGTFTSYTTADGLSQEFVRSICEDREGSMWIGTNGGVTRLREGKFTNYTTFNGLPSDNVRTVLEDRAGRIWIGTDGGGVACLAAGSVKVFRKKDGLPSDSIRALAEDLVGNIWIGTNGDGVGRIEPSGRITTFGAREGLTNLNVYSLLADREGAMWIGTVGGSLFHLKDGNLTNYTQKDGLLGGNVRALIQDRRGAIWIGTVDGGLTRFQGGKFTGFSAKEGLSSNVVFSISEDAEGTLWVGTGGGLNRVRDGKITPYTMKQGLSDDTVFSVLEDAAGTLWMSSNRGVFTVSKRMLDDLDRGAANSLICNVYGKTDGMGANQCNGSSQPAAWKGRDGRLWFATIGGVAAIDATHIQVNRQPPPVTVERFSADGDTFPTDGVVPPGRERFEIQYTGLSFLVPERVRFKFKLEGADRDWIEAGTRRTAYYTNLSPGTYRFLVTACNNDGVWNDQPATFTFTLKPRFYQTWWARALFVGLIGGIAFGGVRWRLNLLKARNLTLEKLVTKRTEELHTKNLELNGKNVELGDALDQLQRAQRETELKNEALARKNQELIESQKRADRIFSALADVLPGTVIDGKYRLESKIGSGGFGAVYRAMHLGLQKPVAVKVFRPSGDNATTANLERFRREGISACRVNHPNAVAVLDSNISNEGIAYLVMELLQGRSLTEELKSKGRIPAARCVELILPVCDALAAAHAAGIIHRDIKPDNIFLHQTPDGEVVKVVDFGIAKLVSDESGQNLDAMTETGGIVGTPLYTAPERFNCLPYDGRADVYSLGVVLFQSLAGRLPFPMGDDGIVGVMIDHMRREPPKLGTIVPEVGEAVETAVARALTKDPEKRPTAIELGEVLAAAVGMTFVPRVASQTGTFASLPSPFLDDGESADTAPTIFSALTEHILRDDTAEGATTHHDSRQITLVTPPGTTNEL